MSEVSVSPKKRRRWWVGLLVLLIAAGGGVWWCNRLTPEERVLVGRWRYTIQTPQGASDELNIEFRNDRTAHGTEIFLRWAARKGQVDLQVIPTNSEVRSYFHLWI